MAAAMRATAAGGAVILAAACARDAAPPGAPAPTAPPPAAAMPALDAELQGALALVERGKLEEARGALEARLAAHPDDAPATLVLALTYHRARAYGAAEPLFEKALALDPSYGVVNHFLGWCRFHLGDLGGAREAFEAHLASAPDESDSHFGLGLVELEEGRLDEAEARFRRAIALIEALRTTGPARYAARKRDLGKCNARLGDVAFERGAMEAARDLYVEALSIDPNQYATYYALARVHRRLGNESEAARLEALHRQIVEARTRGARTPATADSR
jgi:Tfp pilus assembly protein PilF